MAVAGLTVPHEPAGDGATAKVTVSPLTATPLGESTDADTEAAPAPFAGTAPVEGVTVTVLRGAVWVIVVEPL